MTLFTIIVTTIVISMVFDQAPITTEARQLKKAGGQDHFKTESKDDLAPTSAGNNLGMGQKKGNANVEGFQDDFKPTEEKRLQKVKVQNYFKTGTTDDFAPTNPGNSPGMGHKKGNVNVKALKDDSEPTERQLPKTDGQKHFKTGFTDGFAPTSPGNSPGMGHKKGDDFKSTTPGHSSPGIGHAVKNDEPKA